MRYVEISKKFFIVGISYLTIGIFLSIYLILTGDYGNLNSNLVKFGFFITALAIIADIYMFYKIMEFKIKGGLK